MYLFQKQEIHIKENQILVNIHKKPQPTAGAFGCGKKENEVLSNVGEINHIRKILKKIKILQVMANSGNRDLYHLLSQLIKVGTLKATRPAVFAKYWVIAK